MTLDRRGLAMPADYGSVSVGLGHPNTPVVSRLQDARTLLAAPEARTSETVKAAFSTAVGRTLIDLEGDEHRATRRALAPLFGRAALESRSGDIERCASDLIDRFRGDGRAEIVRQFCFPFPGLVLARWLAVPSLNESQLQRWALQLLSTGRPERARRAASHIEDLLSPEIEQRRGGTGSDLLTALANVSVDGQAWDERAIISFLRFLLPAGLETVFRALATALRAVLRDEQLYEALTERPRLAALVVDEALRSEPPVGVLLRDCTAPLKLGDATFEAGTTIAIDIRAVNQDPAVFDAPESFRIDRSPKNAHLSFGAGVHTCLGTHLARAQLEIGLLTLLSQLPHLKLGESKSAITQGPVFRAIEPLMVKF